MSKPLNELWERLYKPAFADKKREDLAKKSFMAGAQGILAMLFSDEVTTEEQMAALVVTLKKELEDFLENNKPAHFN